MYISVSEYQANWFLCQQTENYEQRIREQQEQLSLQQTIIDKLKSQLFLVNSSQGMFILIFYAFLEPLREKKGGNQIFLLYFSIVSQ